MKQEVLIFENSLSGHRAYYVQVLANEILRMGFRLTVALPENASETPEGQAFLSEVLKEAIHLPLQSIEPGRSVRAHSVARFNLLIDAVKHSKANHVYVPYADGISQAWGMRLRRGNLFPDNTVLEGLMMQGVFAYPPLGLKQRVTNEISWQLQKRSGWDRIHQLDPLAFDCIVRRDNTMAARSRLIPEAIEPIAITDRQIARQKLNLDPEDTLIVCPGAVKEGKGADLLARAVCGLPNDVPGKLVLWGKHSPGLKSLISQLDNHRRIHSVDRFATPTEFDCLFAAADVVAVCYPRHVGSASILVRAAHLDKKILASNWGWTGWATRTFELGQECDATSESGIRDGLRQLLLSSAEVASERRKAFNRYHTLENHLAHWTALIRNRFSLSEPSDTIAFPPTELQLNGG